MTRFFPAAAFALVTTLGAATAQEAATVEEMSLGDPEAPVTMIEYASFTCQHCRNFHETSFDTLKEEYIDTGQVHFIFREVIFGEDVNAVRAGLWPALLARCGGEERYFGIVDLLFERWEEWTQVQTLQEMADNLRRIGRIAGLSEDEMTACFSDGEMAQAVYDNSLRQTQADNVSATPSFIIDGELYSNRPYEELTALIDEQLE